MVERKRGWSRLLAFNVRLISVVGRKVFVIDFMFFERRGTYE